MSIVNETPTLAQVIQTALERFSTDLHTAMPAAIVSYERATQKATVQPLLKRRTKNGEVLSWPVVTSVPCLFPRSGDFSLTFELKPEDSGLLICSQRSLDRWLVSGGEVDPQDPRKHSFTDGIFIPGLFSFNRSAPAEENITVLKNKDTRFRLYEDGKMAFANLSSGEELVLVLSDLCQVLIEALTRTAIGPQPFTPGTISALSNIKSRLDTLKE